MTIPNSRKRSKGFTLLEVISGLGIVILILGGVFSIAAGSMDLCSRSNQARTTEIQYNQLGQVLRNTFSQLPPGHNITVTPSSLVISGVSNVLHWPGVPANCDSVALSLAGTTIKVTHYLGDAEVANLPLIENISQIRWSAIDPLTQSWVEVWEDEAQKQTPLVRLQYSTNEEGTIEEVLRIPRFSPHGFIPPVSINNDERTGQ